MASYPTSVKTFTTRNAGDVIQPSHVNDLQDEVNAVEAGLLTGPLTIGGQIKFPAVQSASSDGNTLDDYEEGAWTPALKFGGASVGLTTAGSAGRYIKIGRQVTLYARIALTVKGSSTGAATVSGIPFQAENAIAAVTSMSVGLFTGMNINLALFTAGITNNSTSIDLYGASAAASGLAALTDTAFTDSSDIHFAGSYFSDA